MPLAPEPAVPAQQDAPEATSPASCEAALALLRSRDWTQAPVVALWLQYRYALGLHVVLAAGVTLQGQRRLLGLLESASRMWTLSLPDLPSRGLSTAAGLVCTMPSRARCVVLRSRSGARTLPCSDAIVEVHGGDQSHGAARGPLHSSPVAHDVEGGGCAGACKSIAAYGHAPGPREPTVGDGDTATHGLSADGGPGAAGIAPTHRPGSCRDTCLQGRYINASRVWRPARRSLNQPCDVSPPACTFRACNNRL